MKEKLSKEEKNLIKSVIAYWESKGFITVMEYDIMQITGNNNVDHRYLVEDYIKSLNSQSNKYGG